MARVIWGAPGERFYESGLDRGVLYPSVGPGVPWNGLVSVQEVASGGEPTGFYVDGVKYSNTASTEEFEATLEAYSCPLEFGLCDGTISISNGLFLGHQPRRSFGLAYRSQIGNDLDDSNQGYKIHLIYNALAKPTDRTHKSFNDSVEPSIFSWGITTTPPTIYGFRPTAHFMIDTRMADSTRLSDIENILYGSAESTARLPTPAELLEMFAGLVALNIVVVGDGSYIAEGTTVTLLSPGYFAIDHPSVVDNGDGSFAILDTLISFVALDVVVDGDGSFTAEGTAVDLMDQDTFAVDDPNVIDNGDGSFTIQ